MLNHNHRSQSFYRARYLRTHLTHAERLMWIELRNRRFQGYKFRRQAAIDNYIVDFPSTQLKLIIELDGPSHEYQKSYDAKRTMYLNAKGYHVLRFQNYQVLQGTTIIYDKIYAACLELAN